MGKLFDSPLALVIILAIVVLFGAKRLPDVARGVGRSLRIFKAETAGLMTDDKTPPPAAPLPPQQLPPVAAAEPAPQVTPAPQVIPAPDKTEG